ncbi:MAG: FRG domain-containing protein [Paraglaciecola polaris]|uniref:FRG domain-containing protein n=1 Tax=Paraglaciecola polaris TaxID=222814 RepID=UPI003002608C
MKSENVFGYWKYYSDNFDWNQPPIMNLVNKEKTLEVFHNAGFDEIKSKQLWDSGYVCSDYSDLVIDRYYGGALNSGDMISRLMPSQLNDLFEPPKSRAWVKSATSLNDVYQIIKDAQSKCSKQLMFRGQRQNYFIDREINNPNFTIEGLGEISLLSSFWRQVFSKTKTSFLDFETLLLPEWNKIFYTAYDLDDIEKRQALALENGEWMHSMQDMADSDDPILKEFGNHRLDLAMGMNYNLADTLSTLLQHYGLLSTVIDLTTSPDVALFFATHKYSCNKGLSNYEFVGTNKGKSVLYLIRGNETEMVNHSEDRVLNKIPPERPKKQHCVISRSSAHAVNLPAFFLEGIINLEFELDESESPKSMEDLFPSEQEDKFLNAIREGLLFPDKVSYFG